MYIIEGNEYMKKYVFQDKEYELTKDYKNGFDVEEVKNKFTDYFLDYDYVVGDWSYGKLRLKGFCDKDNSKFKDINDINSLDKYIKDSCSYECRYFVLKKVK